MIPESPVTCSQQGRAEIQPTMPEGPGIYKRAAPMAALFSHAADKRGTSENQGCKTLDHLIIVRHAAIV